MSNEETSFEDIKGRLDEIVDRVSEDGIDLDEALALYEEAVKLGIAACDASELDTEKDEEAEGAPESPDPSESAPVADEPSWPNEAAGTESPSDTISLEEEVVISVDSEEEM